MMQRDTELMSDKDYLSRPIDHDSAIAAHGAPDGRMHFSSLLRE